MTTHNNLPQHTELKGIGPRGLVVMVIIALILYGVVLGRDESLPIVHAQSQFTPAATSIHLTASGW